MHRCIQEEAQQVRSRVPFAELRLFQESQSQRILTLEARLDQAEQREKKAAWKIAALRVCEHRYATQCLFAAIYRMHHISIAEKEGVDLTTIVS